MLLHKSAFTLHASISRTSSPFRPLPAPSPPLRPVQVRVASSDAESGPRVKCVGTRPAGYNVLSTPLSVLPFMFEAAAIAAVYAYTGGLFADDPFLRTLMCGIAPFVGHGVLPLMDMAIGVRDHQPTEHGANNDLVLLHVLSVMALIAWAWHEVASVPMQPLQFGLLACTLGAQGTAVIVSAHELIHSKDWRVKGVGELGTAFVNFWAYSRGHMQHHQLVGTAEDHCTARKGESLMAFMARYLPGHHSAAWQLEVANCKRQGQSMLHNRVFLGMAMQGAFMAAAYAMGGTEGLTLHLTLSSFACVNMTIFEYVQHYGLTRDRSASEPVTRHLSFNSHYPLESACSFNGTYHSHHHVMASKAYADLATNESEPQLPAPIFAWALLALVPPLWFMVMDPLVDAANQQHKQAVTLLMAPK